MPAIFDVIAEPRRRHLLDLLRAEQRSVGELVEVTGLNQPTVSKHLRVLRDAGLVSVTVDAQRRRYAVQPGPLREVDSWIDPYRSFWQSRFDELGRLLDAQQERS